MKTKLSKLKDERRKKKRETVKKKEARGGVQQKRLSIIDIKDLWKKKRGNEGERGDGRIVERNSV